MPHKLTRRKKALFLAIFATGTFLTAEIGARVYVAVRGHDLQEIRRIHAKRRETRLVGQWLDRVNDHPYLPYHPKAQWPDSEMRGLRWTSDDEIKPPDVFRIFCLGGSTTYGGYPAKLEDQLRSDFAGRGLRLEVVNAADVSWTSAESLIDFQFRCLPLQPDAVVVYHGVNDAWPAFGSTWRPDYSHWRTRLIRNEPLVWDYFPRFVDRSAFFVQLRAWAEGHSGALTWKRAMMRYVPDFAHDPYHGVEPYRTNMTNLIAVARAHRIPVLLATHVYNENFSNERYLMALHEINDITRSLADTHHGVELLDAAALIFGDDALMEDVCHFRSDGVGETRLVGILADSVRGQLPAWLEERRPGTHPAKTQTAYRPTKSTTPSD